MTTWRNVLTVAAVAAAGYAALATSVISAS
jgi:hypothetical protein